MTEIMKTVTDAPRAVLTSEARTFGLTYSEMLLIGMIVVALATGPLADIAAPSELWHWHNVVSILATVGACVVSFATGRLTAAKGE